MGLGLDAGADADLDVRGRCSLGGDAGEKLHLRETVDDDAVDAGIEGHGEVPDGLAVAVQVNALRWEARCKSRVELTTGGHVKGHALLLHDAADRLAEQRLAGEGHLNLRVTGLERRVVGAAVLPHKLLVQHVERRPELIGQRDAVAATYHQVALGVDSLGPETEHGLAHPFVVV